MIPTLLQDIRWLLGPQLSVLAPQFHAVVLALLLAAWVWPWIAGMFHLLPKSQPDIEWVTLWKCPRCNTFNRRTYSVCSHCEYSLKVGGAGGFIHHYVERLQESGKKILGFYSFCGWVLFYGLTIFTVYQFRLFTFHQNHLLEFLGSCVLGFLLLSLWFFYQALRPQSKSPMNVLMDGAAGLVITVLLFLSAVAWAEASFQPNKPLAYIQTLPNNQIVLKLPVGGSPVKINAIPIEKSVQFDLQYTLLDWPFLGIRRVYLIRFSGNPLVTRWQVTWNDLLSSPIKKEIIYSPRFMRLNQAFNVSPQASYTVYEAKPGMGLELHTNK